MHIGEAPGRCFANHGIDMFLAGIVDRRLQVGDAQAEAARRGAMFSSLPASAEVGVTAPYHRPHVLIVDDEAALRRAFRTSLAASGFVVEEARSGEEAVDILPQYPFALVLLDINMPGIGGVEACREIRALAPKIGILMVTVRDAENDMVRALEAGADDYVTKPVRFRELVARMRAILRRLEADKATQPAVIQIDALEIDLERHRLRKAGVPIHLTPTEFDLLALLMRQRGTPVTHASLLRTVWGPEYGTELDYLRSYVKALRKKIEDDPAHPKYLLTEPWVGYRFCDPSDPRPAKESEPF